MMATQICRPRFNYQRSYKDIACLFLIFALIHYIIFIASQVDFRRILNSTLLFVCKYVRIFMLQVLWHTQFVAISMVIVVRRHNKKTVLNKLKSRKMVI